MQTEIFILGAAVLIVIVLMLIVLAPSMKNRGYRDPQEKAAFESDRYAEQERERAKREMKDRVDARGG